jgi:hypothetical protein
VAGRTFLGTLRLALLLAVLVFVALGAWLDRRRSTDWDGTLRVTVYPMDGPAPRAASAATPCAGAVDAASFDEAATFLAEQARAYGVQLEEPVRFRVSHAATEPPPALPADPGPFGIALWSLRLRYWAWRVEASDPLPNPDVQVFAVYQPNDGEHAAPDSTGLRKGLIAVAHLFCGGDAVAGNALVVTHELLHTLGATDKYDRGTGQPIAPQGLGDPEQSPLYPQASGEIMAGRIATSPHAAVIPAGLAQMTVGVTTAREIGWLE